MKPFVSFSCLRVRQSHGGPAGLQSGSVSRHRLPISRRSAPPAGWPRRLQPAGLDRHPEVQRWFDQGLMLTYGFNHDAAERSFLRATELDPECAMCWWGAPWCWVRT
jgi:hypothetical protein